MLNDEKPKVQLNVNVSRANRNIISAMRKIRSNTDIASVCNFIEVQTFTCISQSVIIALALINSMFAKVEYIVILTQQQITPVTHLNLHNIKYITVN